MSVARSLDRSRHYGQLFVGGGEDMSLRGAHFEQDGIYYRLDGTPLRPETDDAAVVVPVKKATQSAIDKIYEERS